MTLEIRSIPVLTGKTAERFIRDAEEREKKGKPVHFSKEYADSVEKMWQRSKVFLKEHDGKIKYK